MKLWEKINNNSNSNRGISLFVIIIDFSTMSNSNLIMAACLSLLFVAALGDSWQSYGNFTEDNISDIRLILRESLGETAENGLVAASLTNISNNLNAKWDPAWNTVTAFNVRGAGTISNVVYGYAFNNHWLWHNDYSNTVSVILWKDYNCDSWTTISYANAKMSTADQTNIKAKV